jgi:hypothetical protein
MIDLQLTFTMGGHPRLSIIAELYLPREYSKWVVSPSGERVSNLKPVVKMSYKIILNSHLNVVLLRILLLRFLSRHVYSHFPSPLFCMRGR